MLSKPGMSLFDIKLDSAYPEVIVVAGNDHECEPVTVSGRIKLAVTGGQLVTKRVRLWLVGELDIDYNKPISEMVLDQVLDRYTVLTVAWNNLLTGSDGEIKFGNYGDAPYMKYRRYESFVSKEETDPVKQVVSTGCDTTPFPGSSVKQVVLKKGNYLFPFSVTLPTLFAELVEGIRYGKIHYRLSCGIERPGILERDIWKCRHFRICRTLHPNSMQLVDSIDADNHWPGKMWYNVKLPSRGVAIGGAIPVELTFVPLTKLVDLHMIKAHILQHSHIQIKSHPWLNQTIYSAVGKQTLEFTRDNETNIPVETPITGEIGEPFRVKLRVMLPINLSEISSLCDVAKGLIRVRHRLVLKVILINQEGHLSELRATLPIWVYISQSNPVVAPIYTINEGSKWRPEWLGRETTLFPRRSPQAEQPLFTLPPPQYHRHYEDACVATLPETLVAGGVGGYFDVPPTISKGNKTPNEVPTYLEALEMDGSEGEPAPGYAPPLVRPGMPKQKRLIIHKLTR